MPAAFAVDADRSFWIDDRWKRRVVHYSASGDYLGEAGPLQSAGWDLAVQGGVIFVLVAQEAGSIDPVPFTDATGKRWLIWKEDGNSRKQPTPFNPISVDGDELHSLLRARCSERGGALDAC